MSNRKSTFFLRALVVVVALLLGMSLNAFRHGIPVFQGAAREARRPDAAPTPPSVKPEPQKEAAADVADKASPQATADTPSGEKAAAKEDAPAGDGQGNAAGQPAPPEAAPDPKAENDQALSQPAPAASPDESGQDAKPEEKPSEFTVLREGPESSASNRPQVTSDPEMVQAAGIGREVPIETAAKDADQASVPPEAPQAAAGAAGQGAPPSPEGNPSAKNKPAPPAMTASASAGQSRPERASAKSPAEAIPTPAPPAAKPQAAAAPPALADAGKGAERKRGGVLEIKTQELPGEFVVTIMTDTPVDKVSSFRVDSPARLAVDLMGDWRFQGPSARELSDDLVEKYRVGIHPDRLRLVLQYRNPGQSGGPQPVIEKKDNEVVVRLPKA